MKIKGFVFIIIIAIVGVIGFTQLTVFVVPPIVMVSDGKTLVMLRLKNTSFIDSPDALCERTQGQSTVICRVATLASVLDKAKVLIELPYSDKLDTLSKI